MSNDISSEVMQLVEAGNGLIALGRYSSAAERFEQAIVLCPECTQIWVELGRCYREVKEVERSNYCFAKARAQDADNFFAAFHWGVLKADLGEWEEAEQQFRDAARLISHDFPTLVNLASALFQQRKRAELRKTVEKARRLDPSFLIPAEWNHFIQGDQ